MHFHRFEEPLIKYNGLKYKASDQIWYKIKCSYIMNIKLIHIKLIIILKKYVKNIFKVRENVDRERIQKI